MRRALQYAQNDPNVCGVVAQLMQAPKELEAALDAVLGGSLQNIVTTDDVTAKKLIEYLKRSESGRATFLPLDTVQPGFFRGSLSGSARLASSLVKADPRYANIVSNLLGRIVVVLSLIHI